MLYNYRAAFTNSRKNRIKADIAIYCRMTGNTNPRIKAKIQSRINRKFINNLVHCKWRLQKI